MHIYKIMAASDWKTAVQIGRYDGSAADRVDGFIHFSTKVQLPGTLAKHYAGQDDLVLVGFDDGAMGQALRYEPSRGGDLFPHLYGPLDTKLAQSVYTLIIGPDGAHILPEID